MTTNMNLDEILGRVVVKGPKDDDVVVGRGGRSNHNKGNKKYIELVELYEEDYMKCARKYQKVLAVTILHYLRVKVSLSCLCCFSFQHTVMCCVGNIERLTCLLLFRIMNHTHLSLSECSLLT
jgi:hypothetical protein